MGVDVGGTFTDLILVNEKTGDFFSAKVPSTPHDSSIGVLNGIERVCKNAGIDPNDITHVMHGTTVATNTILTHTGAKVGLVTTRGYRVEAVFTTLAAHHQVSPPTINIFNQDERCDLDYCANQAREMRIDVAISNSFGFGGHNATLILSRYQE